MLTCNTAGFSVDILEKKIKSLINEYFMALDLAEATECISDLKSPHQLHYVVSVAISVGINTSVGNREKTAALLSSLYQQKTLSSSNFSRGIREFLTTFEDVVEDLPFAAKFAGQMCATWIGDGCTSMRFLKDEEVLNLKYSGHAAKLVGTVLKCLLEDVGKEPEYVNNLWKEASLSLSAYFDDSSKIAKFIEDYDLGALNL